MNRKENDDDDDVDDTSETDAMLLPFGFAADLDV